MKRKTGAIVATITATAINVNFMNDPPKAAGPEITAQLASSPNSCSIWCLARLSRLFTVPTAQSQISAADS